MALQRISRTGCFEGEISPRACLCLTRRFSLEKPSEALEFGVTEVMVSSVLGDIRILSQVIWEREVPDLSRMPRARKHGFRTIDEFMSPGGE